MVNDRDFLVPDGSEVRRRRQELALTQERLTETAGVNRRTIQRLEQGKPSSPTTIGMVAKALGCSPSDLLAGRKVDQPPDPPLARYLHDFSNLIAEKTNDFVGRKFLLDEIHAFLRMKSLASGCFLIKAKPGMGKSAIAACLVKRFGYDIHHFNIGVQGINTGMAFLSNICARLIKHYELPYTDLPEGFDKNGLVLAKLLREASERATLRNPVVVVVDALDEVDWVGRGSYSNILFMPETLPPKVFVIATSRDTDGMSLRVSNLRSFPLDSTDPRNMQDIGEYLQSRVKQKALREWLDGQHLSENAFVTALIDKSQGNFMYVRSVLVDIEQGMYKDAHLEAIPNGLDAYYEDHWHRMWMRAEHRKEKLRILYILCELGRPVSRDMLVDFCKEDPITVQAVLDEWSQFLDRQNSKYGVQYSLYHASFRDFLHRKEIVRAAKVSLKEINGQILDNLEGK